jgi:hypothetical protein
MDVAGIAFGIEADRIGSTTTALGSAGRAATHTVAPAGGGHRRVVFGYVAATDRFTATAIIEEGSLGRTAARGASAKSANARPAQPPNQLSRSSGPDLGQGSLMGTSYLVPASRCGIE